MSEVAQSMNTEPKDKQQVLHDESQLIKDNIKFIQSNPRSRLEYDKKTKHIITYDDVKIMQIQLV